MHFSNTCVVCRQIKTHFLYEFVERIFSFFFHSRQNNRQLVKYVIFHFVINICIFLCDTNKSISMPSRKNHSLKITCNCNYSLQFLMSDIKTAKPRIPSPLTGAIFLPLLLYYDKDVRSIAVFSRIFYINEIAMIYFELYQLDKFTYYIVV